MNNIIKPENFGDTVSRGHITADKWDVKFDKEHFWSDANGMHLKDSVLKPIRDKGIVSGSLNGNTLELVKADGTKITTDLSLIVPENTNDTFLKSVTYDSTTAELVFTVGSQTEDKATYRTNVSNLLPVVSEGVIEGNGTTAHPLVLKVDANSGITVTEDGISFSGSIELEDIFGESLGYLVAKGKVRLPPPIITDEGDYLKIDYRVYPLESIRNYGISRILTAFNIYGQNTPRLSDIGVTNLISTNDITWGEADICGNVGPFKECRFGHNNKIYQEYSEGYVRIHKKSIMPLFPISARYGIKSYSNDNPEETARATYTVNASNVENAFIVNGRLHTPTSLYGSLSYYSYGLHSVEGNRVKFVRAITSINRAGISTDDIMEVTEVNADTIAKVNSGMTFYMVGADNSHHFAEVSNLAVISDNDVLKLHSKDYITYEWVDEQGHKLKLDEIHRVSEHIEHGDFTGYQYNRDDVIKVRDELNQQDFTYIIKFIFTK